MSYNNDCEYISLIPRLNIKVQEESVIHIKMLITVLSPKVMIKEINFLFQGKYPLVPNFLWPITG